MMTENSNTLAADIRRWGKRALGAVLGAATLLSMAVAPQVVSAQEEDTADVTIADFNFDDVVQGQSGTLEDSTGIAKATLAKSANAPTVNEYQGDGSQALAFGNSQWLNITKSDGSALLAGLDEVTFSYDVLSAATSDSQAWSLFAARDANAQSYPNEHYLSVIDRSDRVTVQRWNNSGSRDNTGSPSASGVAAGWRHIDLKVSNDSTALYINGELVDQKTPTEAQALSSILGSTGGVLQLGRANWVNGEYFNGSIDNFKVTVPNDHLALRAAAVAARISTSLTLTAEETALDTYGGLVSYTSSNEDVLVIKEGSTAVLQQYPSQQAASAELTATVNIFGVTATQRISVTIPSNDDLAQSDLEAVELLNPDDVRTNLTLPDVTSHGFSITWSSDNETVITDTAQGGKAAGVVTRGASDQQVTLSASIPGTAAKREFALTVKAAYDKPSQSDLSDYMFAYFADNTGEKENIYFATSEDGDYWLDLSNDDTSPSLTTDVGKQGVRDPFLIRSPEGDKFYIIATDLEVATQGWGGPMSTKIQTWESTDLKHWEGPFLSELAAPLGDVEKMWAPEAWWDEATGQYFIYWATNCWNSCPADNLGDSLNMYISTTRDFRSFSKPELWIDRSNSVIDVSIIKIGDWYYRISGDGDLNIEKSKRIDVPTTGLVTERTSDDQWVSVGKLSDFVGASQLSAIGGVEGFEWVTYNPDDRTTEDGKPVYALIADQYGKNAGYRPFRFTDIEDPSTWDVDFTDFNWDAIKKRHGGIISVTAAERKALESAFVTQYTEAAEPAAAGSGPQACYTFDDESDVGADSCGDNALTMHGAATTQGDQDLQSDVLSFDGSTGGYAEFPTGLFDGKSQLTVQMKVNSAQTGNFFTFAFGKNSQQYYMLRSRSGGDVRSAITKGSSGYEDAVTANIGSGWHTITVVFNERTQRVYSDGALIGSNISSNPVNWLGTDLMAYLGKSFYAADGYFKGSIDDVKVWNRALSSEELVSDDGSEEGVLADFDFNDLTAGAASINDATGGAKATVNGTVSTAQNTLDGTTAADLNNKVWLNVTAADGTALLAGHDEVTFSYDSLVGSGKWALFAAPNSDAAVYNAENYLGVMDESSSISVERFASGRANNGNVSTTGSSVWKHVDLVVSNSTTKLYVDGVLKASNDAIDSAHALSAILGQSGGVLQVGKANWTTAGEYFNGKIDNLVIHDRALSDEELIDDDAEILIGAQVGSVPESTSVTGTDSHTAITSTIDAKTKTISAYVRKGTDLSAVPVTLSLNGAAATIASVNGEGFTNGGAVDVNDGDATIVVNRGDRSESWTLSVTVANNPVLPGQYADPDADVFDGKFWIYPTTDGFSSWSGTQFHAWSSTDMVNWTDEGVILDVNRDADNDYVKSPWSVGSAWAPTIEKKNGKYYYYYCAKLPSGTSAIGVAVADNPAGPFLPSEQPLITASMEGVSVGQAIDPSIFTDDDGVSYILYGNGSAAIAQLGDDMTSIVPGSVRKLSGLTDFREAVTVNRIAGKYHWTWSVDDTGSENYRVNYGVSDTLNGAITYKYVLLQKDNANDLKGTAHHSIMENGDDLYIVYHRFYTPLGFYTSGLGYHRETAIDKLELDDEGLFKPVTPTLLGVGASTVKENDATLRSLSVGGVDLDVSKEAQTLTVDDVSRITSDDVAVSTSDSTADSDVTVQNGVVTVIVTADDLSSRRYTVMLQDDDTPAPVVVTSIAVTSMPVKTNYTVGAVAIDTTGLVVSATYSDGSASPLDPDEYELSGFEALTAGNKTITVTLKASLPPVSTSFVVTVDGLLPPEDADREGLRTAINQATGLQQSDYTAGSWSALLAALDNARTALADEEATQERLDAATASLLAAIKDLVKVSDDPKVTEPASPSPDGSRDGTSSGADPAASGRVLGPLAKSGASTLVISYGVVVLLGLGALAILTVRRHRRR
ncbi:MAG: family 43 glycosylhydrolase [Bifidobacterium psychraerophilum]|uniref:family 43 glycosylhydrolase n=1 Tax=Bifidobacterium psychraerophilum TaxID=218140 RepID=UPI0039EAAF65